MRSDNEEPKLTRAEKDWHLSRQQFIRTCVLAGISLPLLNACSSEENIGLPPLSASQYSTLKALLNALLPEDGNGPGAETIKAAPYIVGTLNDPFLDPEENLTIISNLDRFRRECTASFSANFEDLSADDQEAFIRTVSREWGKSWLSKLMTRLFEALLIDPIYDVNPDGAGWKWLNHDPGAPRPTARIKYPEIISNVHEA